MRLIPAHAGKTKVREVEAHDLSAHPRSRGENGMRSAQASAIQGSSPLTRGKLVVCLPCGVACRLIPAHAGKTGWGRSRRRVLRAHPRSRGENVFSRRCVRSSAAHPRSRGENGAGAGALPSRGGSSPLTRGKPGSLSVMWVSFRLIPAHAGKTWLRSFSVCRGAAHPRSRGENVMNAFGRESVKGSSPLTRGKLAWFTCFFLRLGLIPAHAGKT